MDAMPRDRTADMGDLFAHLNPSETIDDGATLLRGFCADEVAGLVAAIQEVAAASHFRMMSVPGGGEMSVAMTNCGSAGWVTDRSGYRYSPHDPVIGNPWPAMPERLHSLAMRAAEAAGYDGFEPDACLINRYVPGAKMGLHQDKDEVDFSQPIVSVSLGCPATFLWGRLTRSDKTRRIELDSGDVMVWGGPSRLVYHGVAPLKTCNDPITGPLRYNLTFRKAL